METPYDDSMEALRRAAGRERPAPAEMASYLEKVRLYAYTVVDRDVDELKHSFSEDEIFEQTVAEAAEAGLTRLEAAMRTLE